MDTSDLSSIQRKIIVWLLSIVSVLVVMTATGTGLWLREHYEQENLRDKVAHIDSTGTTASDAKFDMFEAMANQQSMRDTLITLKLQTLIEGQEKILRRVDRLERTLKLSPFESSSSGSR